MSEKNMGVPAVAAPIESKADLLLQLAERCEREEPSRSLDCAIYLATRLPVAVASHTIHPYTGSLDAAVTLVPEGWIWLRKSVEAMTAYRPSAPHVWSEHIDGAGKTPALALCAAALRARTADAGDEIEEQVNDAS